MPAPSPEGLAKLQVVERALLTLPQVRIQTEHILHAGMYSRTVRLPAGVTIVGCRYRVPTMLIVNGDASVLAGDRWVRVRDYQVIPTTAGRKQVFIAHQPTTITMTMRTLATTVEGAEQQMTDEAEKLVSRLSTDDLVLITGVPPCQE